MTRKQALLYVSYVLDAALSDEFRLAPNARLIGWQCGFEPMFVAVQSYLGNRLDDDEAIEIATDYLTEKRWFDDEPAEPDYVI